MDIVFKRSWVEIDLNRLVLNYRSIVSKLEAGQQVMAVIKADAYGHGDVPAALALQAAGCGFFAVATLPEAVHLRNAGVHGELLVLGYTPAEYAGELVRYDITQALLNEEYASHLAAQGQPVKCHFALDTGMTRIGLDGSDAAACERVIRSVHEAGILRVAGVFTHLSSADMDDEASAEYTRAQMDRFRAVATRLEDLHLPYVHCLNSAGALRHNDGLGNIVRAGIILYGIEPDDSDPAQDGLLPVLSWKSVIAEIRNVREGTPVSYGRTFTAPKPMTLAVIPTGYADGYNRLLSNRGHVLIRGKRAPVVGRICMDQMMVDISGIPEAKVEDTVTLLGTDGGLSVTASDLARLSGTIGYETVCAISNRVPRSYTGKKN